VVDGYTKEVVRDENSDVSEEDIENTFNQLGQETKTVLNTTINETTAKFKTFIKGSLVLTRPQTERLMLYAKTLFDYAHHAISSVLEYLRSAYKVICEGAGRFMEAANVVVQLFFESAISAIRQAIA
jgi:hypothetical protein